MYYYESTTTDPYENLAIEEHLFETLPAGAGLFMLWQNSDAVIVGKYQNTAEEVHAAYVREHGVAVVRRLSGGGTIYTDMGGWQFSALFVDESRFHAGCSELAKRRERLVGRIGPHSARHQRTGAKQSPPAGGPKQVRFSFHTLLSGE